MSTVETVQRRHSEKPPLKEKRSHVERTCKTRIQVPCQRRDKYSHSTEIQRPGAGEQDQQARAHAAPTVWFPASTRQLIIIPTSVPGESNSHC